MDFGEELIERAFAEYRQCEIIRPERLTFREMVKLLSECKLYVTTEGSTAHNSLFLAKGSEVVIVRKADYVNRFQPVVNQIRDLNVTYVDANWSRLFRDRKQPFFGPFLMLVNKRLARFLGSRTSGMEVVGPFISYFICLLRGWAHDCASSCKWFLIRACRNTVRKEWS